MPDERPATLGDVREVREEIKELRGQGAAVLGQLGEIRVQIAQGKGQTDAVGVRTMMICAIAAIIAAALLPWIINKISPPAQPQIIIQQPKNPSSLEIKP